MSARRLDGDAVYEAADLWIASALRSDDSLFTPGTHIWSRERLGEARERFLDRIGEWKGAGFFEHRLPAVLDGGSAEVYQLVGEAVYVAYLIVHKSVVGQAKKMENIDLATGKHVGIPHRLHDALESGIMTPGAFFRNNFGIHPALVIEFVDKWKAEGLGDDHLDRNTPEAPWKFKKVVMDTTLHKLVKGYTYNSPNAQRVALLHLVHPDSFEAMAIKFKEKLAEAPAFQRFTTESIKDPDRRIQQIRAGLESERGHVDFWSDEIRPLWDDNQNNGDNQ